MSNYPDGLPAVAFCQMEGCDYTRSARCPRCGSRLRCACGRLAGHTDEWWDAHEKVCPTLMRAGAA